MQLFHKFTQEDRSIDLLLATLFLFRNQGREEISISEVLDSISSVQEKLSLPYSFSDRIFYSPDLFSDLDKLKYWGYIHRFRYIHDAFLPKSYLRLTPLGIGHSNKILQNLPEETIDDLKKAVANAIKQHEKRWHLLAREHPIEESAY